MEAFTAEEREALAPYFTSLDGPVFALVNLPEVVKGALFARYSRSPKSLRRLFLDEFRAPSSAGGSGSTARGGAEGVTIGRFALCARRPLYAPPPTPREAPRSAGPRARDVPGLTRPAGR